MKQGLRKRDFKNHFEGNARGSTLRKSLGSLFGWQDDRIYYRDGKYRYQHICEKELTNWMKENLLMYYGALVENISDVEGYLINALSPPLNLAKNKSSINKKFREKLSMLRN